MKQRLLFVAWLGLGVIIGAQWPEFFARWNNGVWLVVILAAGFALYRQD